jgi:hypothetical protein
MASPRDSFYTREFTYPHTQLSTMYFTHRRHSRRPKKTKLVSTRPDGTRKYLKRAIRPKTSVPRGGKNIYPLVSEDELAFYDQSSAAVLDGQGECHTRLSRQFVFDPEAAAKRSTVSLFSLLPEKDQGTIIAEQRLIAKKRRKALIQRLGGVRFSAETKPNDGLRPEHKATALFFSRILGETGEEGQCFLKTALNSWKQWVPNPNSWSPQVAWDAIPDELKKKTASAIISFFRRWKDAQAQRLTKTEVLHWGDLDIGIDPILQTVQRGRFQILPGGGCDLALVIRNHTHQSWVDKMLNSPTIQGILRAPISAIHPSIRDRLVASQSTETQRPVN